MKISNVTKILFLLNLLLNKEYTKKELLDEFLKFGVELKEQTLLSYIKKLLSYKLKIEINKKDKEKIYKIDTQNPNICLDDNDIKVLAEIKRLIFAQKNYKYIRELMELFYKLSFYIENTEIKKKFLDFGYFSSVNWGLIDILEEHCAQKDIIILEYILPKENKIKLIEFHCSKVKLSKMSQRMYLIGVLKDGDNLFRLPIENIFSVKKVAKKNVEFNIETQNFTYKITRKLFDKINLEKNEEVIEKNNKFVTIKAPLNDEFRQVQRLLYFCPDVVFVSKGKIKDLLIEKLEMIKKNYEKNYAK